VKPGSHGKQTAVKIEVIEMEAFMVVSKDMVFVLLNSFSVLLVSTSGQHLTFCGVFCCCLW